MHGECHLFCSYILLSPVFYFMALYASLPMKTGIKNACQLLGGYCTFWKCRSSTRPIGKCSRLCPWGCSCLPDIWGR
uniref:Uncharacterized protein n=1 Tax=Catharus ustulatus TaxID=91951 RepID=A0A8C3U5U9_CATUS